MSEVTMKLDARELRGIRAAVLEAVTDQIFDTEPGLLALSDRLLSELSTGASARSEDTTTPGVVQVGSADLEVIDRAFAHAAESIQGWDLPIRIGLTRDELDDLRSRVAARRAD